MIVQARGSSLYLITQPDHAALARRIMAEWQTPDLRVRRFSDSILLATEEHDNGWREPDRTPIIDPKTGRVLDFMTAPGAVRRAIWPRGVERLSHDPWAAALVAEHAIHIYRRYRGDSAWTAFFEEMEGARERHLRRAGSRTLDDLLADYFFVRMGDLVSLTFCNDWTDVQKESGHEIRVDGERVRISPDPFRGAPLAIEITARELPNRPFTSERDAAAEFAAAPTVTLVGTVSG